MGWTQLEESLDAVDVPGRSSDAAALQHAQGLFKRLIALAVEDDISGSGMSPSRIDRWGLGTLPPPRLLLPSRRVARLVPCDAVEVG